MQLKPLAALLTGLVVLGFAAFGVLSADAATPAGFTAVVNPLDQLPGGGLPWSTACPSTHFCVAVGEVDPWQPLVIAGDPATWSMAQAKAIELGPKLGYGGTLYSVACTSSMSCVAV